jgi:hypothetical protein
VTSQGVASGKLAIALGTDMRLLACVELTVSLQVVETTESHLAICTYKWLLLTVCQKVALEIVVAGEFGTAVRTLVLFGTGHW